MYDLCSLHAEETTRELYPVSKFLSARIHSSNLRLGGAAYILLEEGAHLSWHQLFAIWLRVELAAARVETVDHFFRNAHLTVGPKRHELHRQAMSCGHILQEDCIMEMRRQGGLR